MDRWSIAVLAVGGVCAACPAPARAPAVAVELAPIRVCTPQNCGSNSAFVNGSALGALALGGEPNGNGFSIEPALYRGDDAGSALRLDVRDGQLVGVDATGSVAASGDQLKGRWFWLRRHRAGGEERGKVHITEVRFARLMADRRDPASEAPAAAEIAVGYELAYEAEATAGSAPAINLCRYKAPLFLPGLVARTSAALGSLEAPKGQHASGVTAVVDKLREVPKAVFDRVARELPLDEPSTLIFAVKGEAYDEITATVASAPGSFNLACPGTALSKLKLMGYDPEDHRFATTVAQRQAALKMLTGRYCDAKIFTVDGQPLSWDNRGQWFAGNRDGAVEALWNQDGAICLSRPRMAIYTREDIARYCKALPACDDGVSRRSLPDDAELISMNPP